MSKHNGLEYTMKESSVTLQSLVNAQEGPAVVIDADYQIVSANEAYCTSYGVAPEQVVGKRCHEVSHHSPVPCHLNGEQCPHSQVFSTDKPFEVLHVHYDSSNNPDHVRIKAYPLHDVTGGRYLLESIRRLAPSNNLSCEEMQMAGHSPAFLNCVESLSIAAKSDAPVLIYGESGVGKELAAKFIHEKSRRKDKPYVELNCAAIAESLCESELFGHERGAFTGCIGMKQGLFEIANGGTLFLDEIGELSLSIQAKLLRILDSGEFRRVGGEKRLQTEVRVVAATNQNLMAMVVAGTFREDLYFRIAGIKVSIPPLRERRADIPALAELLLKRQCKKMGIPYECKLTPDAVERLVSYNYPGNIRELRNIMQKAFALCEDGIITARHIQFNDEQRPYGARSPSITAYTTAIDGKSADATLSMSKLEAQHIAYLLRQHKDNRRVVANILGISERTLYRKIKRYQLPSAVQVFLMGMIANMGPFAAGLPLC
ncbi:MAG: sigma 54-interacting transcriptional regulator [Sulfuricaulis sp.]